MLPFQGKKEAKHITYYL